MAAMRACPRDAFVPERQRDEDAFLDAPLSLHGMGFNMSAPHMHAACLEALQLQPGHRQPPSCCERPAHAHCSIATWRAVLQVHFLPLK